MLPYPKFLACSTKSLGLIPLEVTTAKYFKRMREWVLIISGSFRAILKDGSTSCLRMYGAIIQAVPRETSVATEAVP
jgi:hypothetical protein